MRLSSRLLILAAFAAALSVSVAARPGSVFVQRVDPERAAPTLPAGGDPPEWPTPCPPPGPCEVE